MFIEDRIEELKEQERAAYIAGNAGFSDTLGELVDVKLELLYVQDKLIDAEFLVSELQAELNRADEEINYLRHRLASAEGL